MNKFWSTVLTYGLGVSAMAACPSESQIQQHLNDFAKLVTTAGFDRDIGWEDARCAREKLAEKWPVYLGQHMGYKRWLSATQTTDSPGDALPVLWGHLYNRTMVDIIAVLPARYGAQPRVQTALLFELKDDGLAQAASPVQALEHIESMVPLIELSDVMVDRPLTDAEFLSMNLGFRGGVLGPELPLSADARTVDMLNRLQPELKDLAKGETTATVRSTRKVPDLLQALMTFAKALANEGVVLHKGDVLCLSPLSEPLVPQPGQRLVYTLKHWPGEPLVTVDFN